MPIYEYRCHRCRRRLSLYLRTFSSPASCPHCGSSDLTRLISRFAVLRSEEESLERLTDTKLGSDFDEQDPRKLARWARQMQREVGEDLGPEFEDVVSRMEQGEMPEDLPGEEALDREETDFSEN